MMWRVTTINTREQLRLGREAAGFLSADDVPSSTLCARALDRARKSKERERERVTQRGRENASAMPECIIRALIYSSNYSADRNKRAAQFQRGSARAHKSYGNRQLRANGTGGTF